jgi:hypothetical protein
MSVIAAGFFFGVVGGSSPTGGFLSYTATMELIRNTFSRP